MKTEEITSFLYFFSAYAQVMATIISLIAVFLIFYVPLLNQRICFFAKNIDSELHGYFLCVLPIGIQQEFFNAIELENSKSIIESIKLIKNHINIDHLNKNAIYNFSIIDKLNRSKNFILNRFKLSFYISGLGIILSLGIIPDIHRYSYFWIYFLTLIFLLITVFVIVMIHTMLGIIFEQSIK